MIKRLPKSFFYSLLAATFLTLSLTLPTFAQETATTCYTTNVGTPNGDPVYPEGCSGGTIDGIEYPPNLVEAPGHPGYYKMPAATDGSYKFYSCENRHYGDKLLIGVLYTVAKNWKKVHPNGYILIGDMTAGGHLSHSWGRAVDLSGSTNGADHVADSTKGAFNRAGTIELGKMFLQTKHLYNLWDSRKDETTELKSYANSNGLPYNLMQDPTNLPGVHYNHFHIDVDSKKLDSWSPSC